MKIISFKNFCELHKNDTISNTNVQIESNVEKYGDRCYFFDGTYRTRWLNYFTIIDTNLVNLIHCHFFVYRRTLIHFLGNDTEIVIPKSIKKINAGAFCHTGTKVKSIEISEGMTEIVDCAFLDCSNLISIKIPNSVKKIGRAAFKHCSNLEKIEIPEGVTYIDDYAFRFCSKLKNITIPNSVKHIGQHAFDGIVKINSNFNANGTLRAFKGFNKDWKCRGFQYEVGKIYHQNGKIESCVNGFHACLNPLDVFYFYYGDLKYLHFAEVELSGKMDVTSGRSKVAASDIKVIREISVQEMCEIYNKMEKINC